MIYLTRRELALALAFAALPLSFHRAEANEEAKGPPKPVFLQLGDFTINLNGKGDKFAFIIISVTMEVIPAFAPQLKDILPRFKEAVNRRLMALADRGALAPGETDQAILKAILSDTLHKVSPEGIKDVLIMRLLYG